MFYSRAFSVTLLLIVFCAPLSFLEASGKTTAEKVKTSCVLKTLSFDGERVSQNDATRINRPSSGKNVTCLIEPHTVSRDLDITSVALRSSKNSLKPTISGTANAVKTVQLRISDGAGANQIYSKTVKVKNGKWKVEIPKKLYDGNFALEVFSDVHKLNGVLFL